VAIPTRNRADRVIATVRTLLRDQRVGAVVVRDDLSDPADFERLIGALAPLAPRVRLARNERNLGPFANKIAVVRDCRTVWAVLLDSDNRLRPGYLDAFYALPAWASNTLYCPARALPTYDFTNLAGVPLDLGAAALLAAGPFRDLMGVFMNTGNYMVPVQAYVERLQPYVDHRVVVDVFFANLHWLLQGGLLFTVPGADYEHDVHEGSWFKQTATESKLHARQMLDALVSNRPGEVAALLATLGRAS
jgi:glycosyltransferase involved in cell wall biosynthesis